MQRQSLFLAFGLILVLFATGYDVSPADAQGRSVLRNQTRNTVRAVTSQVRKLVKPKLVVKRGATGAVTGLALSADGNMLLTILEDETARLWDLKIGRELRAFRFGNTGIRSGQMSPDGKRVVLALEDGSVRLIEAETGKDLRALSGHRGAVLAMAISPDGSMLATGGSDGTLRSWDMESGRPLQIYEGHKKGILSVAISADKRHLASGGADKTARLWSAAGGDAIQIFGKHKSAVTGVAFGADGSSVITGSKDRVIRVWNLSDATEKATFRGSEGAVLTVQVSDQGEFVVAGGEDNTIRMWDLRSGDLVKTMEGHAGAVRTVLFDLGERRLLSASDDGTTKIWDVQSGAVFAQMISTVAGWAVVDRDGRFDGTENAFADVQWEAASQSLELDSFSEQYYEPGLLAKHMRDDNNFINEGVSAVPEGIFLPPSTSFDGQIATQPGPDGRIEVRVIARDEGGRVTGVRLMHNDRLVPAEQITADETETNNRGLETRRVTYRVVPVVGENVFEAVGIGEGDIEGEPAVAQVTLAGQQRKPRLHLLVVGINEYAADELTLDYAKPDAFAILNALSKTGKGLYSEIIGYQLVDRFATRSAILDSLALMNALPPEDVLVVYFAGHGIAVDKDWYFLPTEFDSVSFDAGVSRRVGISSTELQQALLKVGPKRVMFALDACYSGAAVKGIRNFVERKELRDLGRSIGVHVLAATREDQVAYEFPVLQQGLLTYTLLQGAGGAADSSGNGAVSAKEVIRYSRDMLPQLARQQYPTISQTPVAYSRGRDFELFQGAL